MVKTKTLAGPAFLEEKIVEALGGVMTSAGGAKLGGPKPIAPPNPAEITKDLVIG